MADIAKSEPPSKKRTIALTPVYYNTDKWIEENKKYFLPPVCNKMMCVYTDLVVFDHEYACNLS